jgi:hypothetical protein
MAPQKRKKRRDFIIEEISLLKSVLEAWRLLLEPGSSFYKFNKRIRNIPDTYLGNAPKIYKYWGLIYL